MTEIKATEEQFKKELAWIETANLDQLIHRRRFGPLGDIVFCDSELYKKFEERMSNLRKELGQGAFVAASKRVGWMK